MSTIGWDQGSSGNFIVDDETRPTNFESSRRKNGRLSRGEAIQLARKSSTRILLHQRAAFERLLLESSTLYRDAGRERVYRSITSAEISYGHRGIRLIRPSRTAESRFFSQRWNIHRLEDPAEDPEDNKTSKHRKTSTRTNDSDEWTSNEREARRRRTGRRSNGQEQRPRDGRGGRKRRGTKERKKEKKQERRRKEKGGQRKEEGGGRWEETKTAGVVLVYTQSVY